MGVWEYGSYVFTPILPYLHTPTLVVRLTDGVKPFTMGLVAAEMRSVAA
jgi:hypothetical protein